MFHAVLIACLLGATSPDDCRAFRDTEGPYETQAECRERLAEMRTDLVPQLPPHRGWMRCDEVRELGEAA